MRCAAIPTSDELAKIYTHEYYRSWGTDRFPAAVEAMKRRTFGRILQQVEALRPEKGRLLDVGCAMGYLMMEARSRGWDAYGVEVAGSAVDQARRTFGGHVHAGLLEDDPFAGTSFEAITMIDLLEHVTDPNVTLARAYQRLAPGGILAIGTPDIESRSARIWGGRWEHIKQEHLYYFSPRTLRSILEKHGFTVLSREPLRKSLNPQYITTQLEVYPIPVVTPVFRSLQAVLPESLKTRNFWVTIGEMLCLARRPA